MAPSPSTPPVAQIDRRRAEPCSVAVGRGDGHALAQREGPRCRCRRSPRSPLMATRWPSPIVEVGRQSLQAEVGRSEQALDGAGPPRPRSADRRQGAPASRGSFMTRPSAVRLSPASAESGESLGTIAAPRRPIAIAALISGSASRRPPDPPRVGERPAAPQPRDGSARTERVGCRSLPFAPADPSRRGDLARPVPSRTNGADGPARSSSSRCGVRRRGEQGRSDEAAFMNGRRCRLSAQPARSSATRVGRNANVLRASSRRCSRCSIPTSLSRSL